MQGSSFLQELVMAVVWDLSRTCLTRVQAIDQLIKHLLFCSFLL
jgi:hypothetical protein